VARDSDGRLEAFVRGTDSALWQIRQDDTNSQRWSAWASLGGSIRSDPTVVLNSDGRLEVFARGTDKELWHIWQEARYARKAYQINVLVGWSAWAPLGGRVAGDPTVAVNSDGRLEVFTPDTDNTLWHAWQQATHSQRWSAWASLGRP
jgi:hypothetical protein